MKHIYTVFFVIAFFGSLISLTTRAGGFFGTHTQLAVIASQKNQGFDATGSEPSSFSENPSEKLNPLVTQDGTFSFTLAAPANTSAGVYKDGILIRTLWSNVPYSAGAHINTWDGKDDDGATAPS